MSDYRQSPSFWPFTVDWFRSVKFVSPSKSIKRIQWDSFPHWAVIALVIGKLREILIASKRKPADTNFLHGCFAWITWYCRQHMTFTHAKMLLVPMKFFSLTDRLGSGGKRFDWANVIFAAYFILRGRDTHINFLRLLFMVGMICPLMQEHFLSPLLKSKALQCG